MADIAVNLLVQRCAEGLLSQISYDVDKNLRSLRDKLSWLLACIKDADKTKGRENERAKLWMSQIIDIAHDAEDALDSIIHNMARQTKKRRYFYFLEKSRLSHLLEKSRLRPEAVKIEDILQRIDEIVSNRSQFGIENPHVGGGTDSAAALGVEELFPPLIANEEMDAFGMDDDASLLAEKLIQGTEKRHVVSIVGMGGIGKTTLAKILYNRDDIMKNFECQAWVCVSLECKVKDILEGIIKCLPKDDPTKDDLELLQRMNESDLRRRLHQHLEGKRYLVVLDDVWHEEAWDSLKAAFPDETTRSRLLITTRNREVALHANSFLHQREFLGEEESWNLFCQKAFPNDISYSCHSHLEELGREIVSECGGLPLAIASVGKLLSTKGNLTREWVKVGEMVLCKLRQEECKITSRLSSSYLDLPYDLKSCFLYFAAFPKGFEIQASTLIELWIAEGFIKQRGEEPIEETAEDCLNKLASRSMIQVAKVNCHGVKTCRIHDLHWDLSISKAKEVKFLERCGGGSRTPNKVRRLSISLSDSHSHKCINFNRDSVHLHSLLYISGKNRHVLGEDEWSSICECFSFLRILHLHSVSISDSIAGIENLVHLRYLGLRDCDVKCIPSGISNLCNLQTLDLRNNCIAEFPDEIWKLKQLRHLRLEEAKSGRHQGALIPEDVELSHFVNLRTLIGVRAGMWMDAGKERLTNLRKLVIDGVTEEYKELFSRFKSTKLKSLKFSTLAECLISLSSFSGCPNLDSMHLVGVLEKVTGPHQFPPYLTKLTLRGSQMGQDSLATLQKLQNLSSLKLKTGSYVGSKMIFTEGGFPRLQVLIIDSIDELEELITEGAMPGLIKLVITGCSRLEAIPAGAMLGLTHIIGCPRLNEIPAGDTDTGSITSDDDLGSGGREKGLSKDMYWA